MNITKDKLPPLQPDNHFVVLDVEIFNAEKHRLHRPNTGDFACVSCAISPEDIYVYTDEKIVELLMGRLENTILVMHNAQFDLAHLRRWAKVEPQNIYDTMLIERILYSGYYDRFSLADLARRYLSIYLDKDVRSDFIDATELTPELIEYSAIDASRTYQILEKQVEELKKRKDAFRIWKEIDMPAVWAYLDFQGFRLDVKQWEELATSNKERATSWKQEFMDELGINPNSPAQVKKALIEMGFTGLPSTGADILEQYITKHSKKETACKIAQDILDYRKVAKLASTYGMNYIDKYVEEENDYYVIYSDFKVIGAETGRSSSSDPPMQNLPVRNNPEFRQPWIARPGNKLIVADYSAQEPRVSAYLTQDKNLIDIFRTGNDVYIEVAKRVHDKEITKEDDFRNDIKTDFLAASYGQMAQDAEHEERLAKFFDYFPELYKWTEEQRGETNYVESVMGRRLWCNPFSSQMERNNLNHPHQSSSADMMKKAISTMHQNWKWDCPFGIVGQVHDEMILDVPEELSKEIAEVVSDTMVQVAEEMCPGVPFKANAVICDNWLQGKG